MIAQAYDIQDVSTVEAEEAAIQLWPDFQKLVEFHKRIQQYAQYGGRNAEYDAGLRKLVEKQRELMFGLRNLYADAYELLPEEQRSTVFKWIVQATGELSATAGDLGLSNFGIAPLIIVAGVVLTAATATALVAWHRSISLQGEQLEYQQSLLPLVEAGVVPSDLLQPIETPGIAGVLGNLGTIALVIALIWAATKFFGGK